MKAIIPELSFSCLFLQKVATFVTLSLFKKKINPPSPPSMTSKLGCKQAAQDFPNMLCHTLPLWVPLH